MADGSIGHAQLPSEWLREYVRKRGGALDIAIHTLVAG